MEITKLLCRSCKKVKPLTEFDRTFFGKKGYDVYCHDCRIEINRINEKTTEKRCRQCNIVKPISEFGKNASSRDGYLKECLDCQDENNQRRRARENKDIWDGKTNICKICGLQKPIYEFTRRKDKYGKYVYCRSCNAIMVRKKVLKFEQQREAYGWPIEKRCKGCGRLLPSDHFHLDRQLKDGLAEKCNECTYERHRKWLKKIKETRSKKKIKKNILKECQICHELKPVYLFTKNEGNKDGYGDQCNICRKNVREENIRIWTRQRKEKKIKLKEMKCRICGRVLPISSFSKNRENKKGYYYHCKDCHKQKEKNIEKRWEKDREKAVLEFSLDFKFEKKCKICGKILPLSMFWKRCASKDGHNHYCKACAGKKIKERKKRLKERGFPEELIPDEKQCGKCGRILSKTFFRKNSTSSDGLDARCKECRNKYYKEYSSRPEVKQKKREYNRRPEVMERRRKQAREYLRKPGVKERRRAYKRKYIKRPYVKERRREYDREYQKRPEVKKRKKEYDSRPEARKRRNESTRKWRLRKEQEKMLSQN